MPIIHPTNRPVRATRHDDLDALRVILMALIVVIHAANIYSMHKWVINDTQRSFSFEVLLAPLNVVTVPCFFLISGLLCAEGLRQKGTVSVFFDRIRRLGVPLIATALLLNSAQAAILSYFGRYQFSDYYDDKGWLMHLWFLHDLLIYHVASIPLWAILNWLKFPRAPLWGGAIILVAPILSLIPGTFHHFGFFAFGMMYRPVREDGSLRRLAAWSVPLFLLACLGVTQGPSSVRPYWEAALSWSSSLICLELGNRFLNRPSNAFRTLSDASYSVYLIHHPIVVLLGLAFLSVSIPMVIKFALILIIAFGASLAAHHYLIRRNSLLGFLFNGDRLERDIGPGGRLRGPHHPTSTEKAHRPA